MTRQLTDADRARAQAFMDAMQEAMNDIAEFDPDRVREAAAAVHRAHPIEDSIREAYSAELASKMTDPLQVARKNQFLNPDSPWGLVLYRTSYGDDTAWQRMLARVHDDIREALVSDHEGPDQLDMQHRLVVMDDRSEFENAEPHQVRTHFNNWVVDELKRNWRPGANLAAEEGDIAEYLYQAGARYNFCLLVDDVCLESLDNMTNPVVKIINRRWAPGNQEGEDDLDDEGDENRNLPWEGGVSGSEFEDVGWMYMHVGDYVTIQSELSEADEWAESYVRPPLMRWESDWDRAPGFWRRSRLSR